MTRRRIRSCYPLLGAHDHRWAAAVFGVWALVAVLGMLAAVGAGTVARWIARLIGVWR